MAAAKEDLSGIVFGAGGSVRLAGLDESCDPAEIRRAGSEGHALCRLRRGAALPLRRCWAGRSTVYTGDVAEQAAHIGAGTMRVLAVMAPERLDAPYDQFPTARELGYDAVWSIVRGFYMGKDVSDEDYDAWVAAFNAAL